MERNREARRASIVGSNGFTKRRQRTNSLRDSPDDDGGVERLRDRVKKDRDRERKQERERDLRERPSRSKRRRAEGLMNNRVDTGVDETSEESVDEEDDEYEENAAAAAAAATAAAAGRLLPPVVGSISNLHHSRISQQQHSNSTNNIISVSVPRKARSGKKASTKRSYEWISSSSNISGGGAAGGEQILRQASSSPARQGLVSASTPSPSPSPAAPMSPSSSNTLFRKKLKLSSGNNGGPKLKPPKSSSKQSCSNPEELEIEIAEVLYGLMTQSQGPSPKKEDSSEVNRSSSDVKSQVLLRISNSNSTNNQILGPNSIPLQAAASKRKRPRQVPENSNYGPVSTKIEMDQTAKSEISSPNLEKTSRSMAENGFEMVGPRGLTEPDSMKMDSELKPEAEGLRGNKDLVAKEDVSSRKEKEYTTVRNEDKMSMDSTTIATASVAAAMIKSSSMVSELEIQKEQKFEIDLMAPPPQIRSFPERETKIHSRAAPVDRKPLPSMVDAHESKPVVSKDKEDKKEKREQSAEERKGKGTVEADESNKEIENKGSSIGLKSDFEKIERNMDAGVNETGNKLQQQTQKDHQQQVMPLKAKKEDPLTEKSGQSKSSLPLPMPMASWPGGLPPMGYLAPLQGVVSMDSSHVAPTPIQPLFSQPRLKRCATHCYIARNIQCLQQLVKMNNPFLQTTVSASLSKPSNLNVTPTDLHGNVAGRCLNNAQDKGQSLATSPNHGGKDKGSQFAGISDSVQRTQQILIQQGLPPKASSNLVGPTFIFPLNQQQAAAAAASARPSSVKSTANEAQYLTILQNNGYSFPIPTPNYRGTPGAHAMPLFNSSFYSSQMIHPSQLQNASASSGTSSSQKHTHPSRPRQRESETGRGDSPPTTDSSRVSRASMNVYGPSILQNFALMTPPAALASAAPGTGSSSNPCDKKSHNFAMSFGPINGTGTGPGIDITSMAQNHHAFIQSFPEATRQNIQMMAAAQKNNNFRPWDDDKSGRGGDSTAAADAERIKLVQKPQGGGGQSRSDLVNAHVSSIQTNSLIESSSRSLNVASVGPINAPNVHIQGQLQNQQQQMVASAVNRPVNSSGSIFSDHLSQSSIVAPKLPNALSRVPQNLVQSNSSSSPAQSPQWKSSTRTSTSSISKGANESPRTTNSASTNTKTGQGPSLLAQQPKNSTSIPIPKSPSILGNPNAGSSSSNGSKPPMQQQLPKNMQQAHLFFSNPYSQSQSPHSTLTSSPNSGPTGFYMQRRRQDQHQQPNTSTNDPAKAIVEATTSNNVKGGGGLPSHGIIQAAQFAAAQSAGALLSNGFSYVHPVPMKSAEQKQHAG